MKTEFIKKAELKKNWVLIDAENAVLGRLAVISANILRGKNKALLYLQIFLKALC